MRFLFFALIISLVMPSAAAHLDGGEDKRAGGYIIDFGFSPAEIRAGEKTILAFNLVNETTRELAEFESAWVRISTEDVVFSGTLMREAGHVSLLHTFPEGGEYEILVRFMDKGETIIEETFVLRVERKSNPLAENAYIIVLAVLGVLIAAFLLGQRYLKKKNNFWNKFGKGEFMKKFLALILLVPFIVSGCTQASTTGGVTLGIPPLVDEDPSTTVQDVSLNALKGVFEPGEFTVKKDVPVRIALTATDIDPKFKTHGFAIKEFGIQKSVDLGNTEIVEFTPTKTGSFVYYCSVYCGEGHMGQAGIMHVIE